MKLSQPPRSLRERVAWITALRLAFLTLLLLLFGIFYFRGFRSQVFSFGTFSSKILLLSLTVGFLTAGISAFLLRIDVRPTVVAYGQILFDQLTWTSLAYISGGLGSGATSLYGLTCVTGAILCGVRGVVVATASAATLMLAMALAFGSRSLFPPADQNNAAYATRWDDLSYPLTLNLLVLAVVAFLAGYLAERLRRTRGQLADATARVEQAERLALLGQFAAGLAHELRNPLGSIVGSIDLLAQGPTLSDEDRLLCDIVARETRRLNHLVDDMLTLCRPRLPNVATVDLARLTQDVVILAARSGRGLDVQIVYDGPPRDVYIKADGDQLRQVLWNLVRNGTQVSSPGSALQVRVQETPADVRLEVRDSGSGIPDDMRESIFEPFFTRRTQGTGIGLAVVKRIVEDHGWSIEVASEAGRGTAFCVQIPTCRLLD